MLTAAKNGLVVGFQQVPDVKSGKNRLHLDLIVDDLDGATAEIEGLGGRWLEPGQTRELEGFQWRLMADPDGNEFDIDVLPPGRREDPAEQPAVPGLMDRPARPGVDDQQAGADQDPGADELASQHGGRLAGNQHEDREHQGNAEHDQRLGGPPGQVRLLQDPLQVDGYRDEQQPVRVAVAAATAVAKPAQAGAA